MQVLQPSLWRLQLSRCRLLSWTLRAKHPQCCCERCAAAVSLGMLAPCESAPDKACKRPRPCLCLTISRPVWAHVHALPDRTLFDSIRAAALHEQRQLTACLHWPCMPHGSRWQVSALSAGTDSCDLKPFDGSCVTQCQLNSPRSTQLNSDPQLQVHCALLRAVENRGLEAADAARPELAKLVHEDSEMPLQWTERAAGSVLAAPEGWVSAEARVRLHGC